MLLLKLLAGSSFLSVERSMCSCVHSFIRLFMGSSLWFVCLFVCLFVRLPASLSVCGLVGCLPCKSPSLKEHPALKMYSDKKYVRFCLYYFVGIIYNYGPGKSF